MSKKYTVFVSSTYVDLKEERQQILENILQIDCIPVGMEYFQAEDDDQFNIIKKLIDDCDFYILIIGGRYGTINQERGLSFTEMEYDYAVEKGIPVLVFDYDNVDKLPIEKRETEEEKIKMLEKFKIKAMQNRMAKKWNDKSSLILGVILSLNNAKKYENVIGWTRSNLNTSELLLEINELRKKNIEIIKENTGLKHETDDKGKESDYMELETIGVTISHRQIGSSFTEKFETNMKEIFMYMSAKLLGSAKQKSRIEWYLREMVGGENPPILINPQTVDVILNQLIARNLMKDAVSDKQLFFGLTKLGMDANKIFNLVKKDGSIQL